MKKKFIPAIIFSILAALFILPSCTLESTECGDPVSNWARLVLVDSSDQLLIGTVYTFDSVRLKADTTNISLYYDRGSLIFYLTNLYKYNLKNYYLYLGNGDTDTLNLKVNFRQGDCFDAYVVDTMIYNGEMIPGYSTNTYVIKKY